MFRDDWLIENHRRVAECHDAWYHYALGLFRSAGELRARNVEIKLPTGESGPVDEATAATMLRWPVILMLEAMAIEDLLKGLLVQAGATIVEAGEFVGFEGVKNLHNLSALANAVANRFGVVFKDQEHALLRCLSRHTTRGRYPVGKRALDWNVALRDREKCSTAPDALDDLIRKLVSLTRSQGDDNRQDSDSESPPS